MIIGEYIFKVDYSKKGKSTGKRSMLVYADDYDEVINETMLEYLCEKVHGFDLMGHGLNEEDVRCIRTNDYMSQHSIIFRDGNDKIITEYLVDIEPCYRRKAKV